MDLHRKLELRMADFLGKEDAIIFNMGYATNSTSISALIGKVHATCLTEIPLRATNSHFSFSRVV